VHAPVQLYLVPKQLEAVRAFAALRKLPRWPPQNKRVGNILKKVEGAISDKVDASLLQESAEQSLHQALSRIARRPMRHSDRRLHRFAAVPGRIARAGRCVFDS